MDFLATVFASFVGCSLALLFVRQVGTRRSSEPDVKSSKDTYEPRYRVDE